MQCLYPEHVHTVERLLLLRCTLKVLQKSIPVSSLREFKKIDILTWAPVSTKLDEDGG